MGNKKQGKEIEDRFRTVTGATETDSNAAGDANFEGDHVEIKYVGLKKKDDKPVVPHRCSDTINQVRAVKYITVVVFQEATQSWYVIPAPDVLLLIAKREPRLSGAKRGQHTENPYESVTLRVKDIREYRVVNHADLPDRLRLAAKKAKGYPKLRGVMTNILNESAKLAKRSDYLVKQELKQCKIL